MADTRKGKVELICGSMFAGKTEEMIRRLTRAQYAHQRVQVFSHGLDTRYGTGVVASHNGLKLDSIVVRSAGEVLERLDPAATVVAIDEAQFFDWKIVDVVVHLAAKGIRVLVAGLDSDFRGDPFGPMPLLLVEADEVTKLNAICVVCGEAASRTQRLIDGRPAPFDSSQILVGGVESYEARCRHCHQVPGKP